MERQNMGRDSPPQIPPTESWLPGKAERRQVLGGALLLGALVGVPLRAWHQQVEGQAAVDAFLRGVSTMHNRSLTCM